MHANLLILAFFRTVSLHSLAPDVVIIGILEMLMTVLRTRFLKAALWGVTEFSNTLEKHKINIPKKLYLIVDDDHNVINLSVYTALIALLLKHDVNQIIGCNTQLFHYENFRNKLFETV